MRTIAIGDVHGCAKALRTLLELVDPRPEDRVVFLGDYVDRGPDSRNVVDQILELQQRCEVVALRGNHEIMLLGILMSGLPQEVWLECGGRATLASYGGSLRRIPQRHVDFFCSLLPYFEAARDIFVHANYLPDQEMDQQPERRLYWDHLIGELPPPHRSGKRVILGHTPQATGEVLDAGHVVCLDTGCFGGRWLTAMDCDSGDTWQTDIHGHERRRRGQETLRWLRMSWDKLHRRLGRGPSD